MKVETIAFHKNKGWSVDNLPDMDSENTLIFVFGASSFVSNTTAIKELIHKYPNSSLVGCSTAGEIFNNSINDESLSVAILKFSKTKIQVFSEDISKMEDSHKISAKLAEKLKQPDLKAVMVFSDGLTVNGSELVKGFNDTMPEDVIVSGGLAGDGEHFAETWVLKDKQPHKGVITAVGFYGDCVNISFGSKGGWDRFGPERIITRSIGNVLYEIDGQPALKLYKEYLGDMASGLPASALLYPLAVKENIKSEKLLVRTILSVNENEQSMTFAGDVPQGWSAQLMKANFDRLIDGALQAGNFAKNGLDKSKGDKIVIAISCVGRRIVLGERSEEEVEATLESMPEGTHQVGFYSYGEISPIGFESCNLHNQTMTLTTISEQ